MSSAENSTMYFTPQEAEWVVNYGSRYGGAGLDMARAISRTAREIAAPYLTGADLESAPETLRDCWDTDAPMRGDEMPGFAKYVTTTLKVRSALQENYRQVPFEANDENRAALGLMVGLRREELDKQAITKKNLGTFGLEAIAVYGLDHKLMTRHNKGTIAS